MKIGSIRVTFGVALAVRLAYAAIVAFLAIFAMLTFQELKRLRSAPVILPRYEITIVDTPEKTSAVTVVGTWYVVAGPPSAYPLQTTAIECKKSRLQ